MTTLYLFSSGRTARLGENKAFPTEFYYGYLELEQAGADVEMIEEDELCGEAGPEARPLLKSSGPARLFRRLLAVPLPTYPTLVVLRFVRAAVWKRLNRYSAVVATTNGQGLALCFLKRFGLLRTDIFFVVMGVVGAGESGLQKAASRWLLRSATLLAISKSEAAHLRRLVPGADIHYVPFGVDNAFWTPSRSRSATADEPYVLSIGNDLRRDYRTLISAWRDDFPKLRIVTRLPVHSDRANIEVIQGGWREQVLSDDDVLELFRGALFVILPIHKTVQPSGQSACLQAMACGKAVVLSDIEGLWDRALMVDDQTCLLVPPEEPGSLGRTIDRLITDGALRDRIGTAGRQIVDQSLNVQVMAAAMADILSIGAEAAPQSRYAT